MVVLTIAVGVAKTTVVTGVSAAAAMVVLTAAVGLA
jgi:hypothetical protein